MLVALDTNACYTSAAGVARYVRGLQKGLEQLQISGHSYDELAWPVYNLSYTQPQRALKTVYRELVWGPFVAPGILAKRGVDLFHTTGAVLVSPKPPIKHVVTLHDMAVWRHPERFRRWHRFSAKTSSAKLLNADRVICISKFTADEAMQLIGLPAAKIDVVHNGSDFHASDCPAERKPHFKIPSEFFLFVGSLEPGKNLALLRQTYELAEAQKTPLPPLLIVGARWDGVCGEGAPPQNWHYLGRLSDDVLVFLYRRALALVYPSKYEGFGLPVPEAMALGCPVICSRVASLPEVAGDAALFAELNPEFYLSAMLSVTADLSFRSDLVSKGFEQAKQFSWRKCAEQTAVVYERAFRSG